ncbi:MAG: hypothetical protein JO187_00775 [Acidobacteria bacterium]|nr:hypothetical protein [Acidobacteriota bacterium]
MTTADDFRNELHAMFYEAFRDSMEERTATSEAAAELSRPIRHVGACEAGPSECQFK